MKSNKHIPYPENRLYLDKFLDNPLDQFVLWYQAYEKRADYPGLETNTMTLSTVGENARPHSRIVLMKDFTPDGLVFYTNYHSQKGNDIASNPFASALFWWSTVFQQIRIEGRIKKIPDVMSDEYFESRPRGSQVAALVSKQSAVLTSKDKLLTAYDNYIKQHDQSRRVPRPAHWGGYYLIPDRYEFWQASSNRLHDRIVYTLDQNTWSKTRLYP